MEHLTSEHLARLVDEAPTADEAAHLVACEVCAAELDGLRDQRRSLRSLPEIVPPVGDWTVLEARLRSEGLVQDPGVFQRLGLAQTPQWMKAAAAVMLFLSGTGTGALLTGSPTDTLPETMAQVTDVDVAASAVRVAEQGYVTAVGRYQELLAQGGGEDIGRQALPLVS